MLCESRQTQSQSLISNLQSPISTPISNQMASTFVLNSFAVDRRLETIYKAMHTNDITKAANVANSTLRMLNTANYSEIDRHTRDYLVSNLYTTLVDLAMGRVESAHNKIRNCHYKMLNSDLERQEVEPEIDMPIDEFIPCPCPSPAELEPESDVELEELLYVLFNGAI